MSSMNRAVTGLWVVCYLVVSTFSSTLARAEVAPTGDETGKARLMSAYQSLANMSDEQWTQELIRAAARLRDEGKKSNAEVLLNLTDPAMRMATMDLIKTHIDDQSQNGLILLMGSWRCWGFGCVIFALMFFASLDGEHVENF